MQDWVRGLLRHFLKLFRGFIPLALLGTVSSIAFNAHQANALQGSGVDLYNKGERQVLYCVPDQYNRSLKVRNISLPRAADDTWSSRSSGSSQWDLFMRTSAECC